MLNIYDPAIHSASRHFLKKNENIVSYKLYKNVQSSVVCSNPKWETNALWYTNVQMNNTLTRYWNISQQQGKMYYLWNATELEWRMYSRGLLKGLNNTKDFVKNMETSSVDMYIERISRELGIL